jgi:hypothetical protein
MTTAHRKPSHLVSLPELYEARDFFTKFKFLGREGFIKVRQNVLALHFRSLGW